MEDREIVALYWARSPDAIEMTAGKYGGYCKTVAQNIVGSAEDAEECVNDAYLRAWNSIPPQRPANLAAYLGKLVRHLSFDRWRSARADKRGGGQMELVLDELADCVPGDGSVEGELDRRELLRAVEAFLDGLSREKRQIFLCRYWFALPVSEIAKRFGRTEGSVSVILNRTRNKLKLYLAERGYDL